VSGKSSGGFSLLRGEKGHSSWCLIHILPVRGQLSQRREEEILRKTHLKRGRRVGVLEQLNRATQICPADEKRVLVFIDPNGN
jgi:hypothetical protein